MIYVSSSPGTPINISCLLNLQWIAHRAHKLNTVLCQPRLCAATCSSSLVFPVVGEMPLSSPQKWRRKQTELTHGIDFITSPLKKARSCISRQCFRLDKTYGFASPMMHPPPMMCHPPLTCHPHAGRGVWRWLGQRCTLAFGAKSLLISPLVFHMAFVESRLSRGHTVRACVCVCLSPCVGSIRRDPVLTALQTLLLQRLA